MSTYPVPIYFMEGYGPKCPDCLYNVEQCICLPPGQTCIDCYLFATCSAHLGRSARAKTCVFSPPAFYDPAGDGEPQAVRA